MIVIQVFLIIFKRLGQNQLFRVSFINYNYKLKAFYTRYGRVDIKYLYVKRYICTNNVDLLTTPIAESVGYQNKMNAL